MTPPTEYFFTYIEYMDKYLDLLFNKENIYIKNKDIFNESIMNKELIEQNSISMYISQSPVIVKNIISDDAKLLLYNSDTNIDYKIITDCINTIDEYEDINEEELKKTIDTVDNKITIENLEKIVQSDEYENIGFLYITKQFSKIENKYDVYFIIKEDNLEQINVIILFDMIDNEKEYLTNIIINDKQTFTIDELLEESNIKRFLENNDTLNVSMKDIQKKDKVTSTKKAEEAAAIAKAAKEKSDQEEVVAIAKADKEKSDKAKEDKAKADKAKADKEAAKAAIKKIPCKGRKKTAKAAAKEKKPKCEDLPHCKWVTNKGCKDKE